MVDTLKDFARKDILIAVVGVFILALTGAGVGIGNKLVGKNVVELQSKVSNLQNQILVMDTTSSHDQNNVVIENKGCDANIKAQNDRDMVKYLVSALAFENGNDYNKVRTNLASSLSQREVEMIMPENVQISDNLWQSDAEKWSLEMDGFKSYCIDCSDGYKYFATVSLKFGKNGANVCVQRYMMTYSMSQDGNITGFKMMAITAGSTEQ